jgi:hypothetical protein
VSVVSVDGRVVRAQLSDVATSRRARPAGTTGAAVFAYVGPGAPPGTEGWTFRGVYTRPVIEVPFAADVPAGSVVWLTAQWLNPRGQPGPIGSPACVHLGGGLARAA